MKLENGWVEFTDADGRDADNKVIKGCTRRMTVEQYAKHARDPEFVKARPALEHGQAMAAAQAEAEAVAFMAGAK